MMTPKPLHLSLPDAEFEAFDLLNFGAVAAPALPSRFGFQIDVTPSVALGQVVFGLMQQSSTSGSRRVGFGIRVDLERGEIWDIVNGSGLIGWVEDSLCHSTDDKPERILFSLEIERIGTALLPKLQIGGEEWLYPAVRSEGSIEFMAIGGCSGIARNEIESDEVFANASVWTDVKSR